MVDLLIQYYKALNDTKIMLENAQNDEDKRLIRGIISEITYIIDWLRSGHNPNEWKIEKRSLYLVDHKTLELVVEADSLYNKICFDEYNDYIENVHHPISQALGKLTKRELEVFIMTECECMSHMDTAELLCISKGSVQKYLERAKKKINYYLHSEQIKKDIFKLKLNKEIFRYLIRKFEYEFDKRKLIVLGDESKDKDVIIYLMTQFKTKEIKALLLTEKESLEVKDVCKKLNISKNSYHNLMNEIEDKLSEYFV